MAQNTTTTSMPGWVQPYAQGYLQRAQQVADTPYQPYQGERVAGFNQLQAQGFDAMASRAMQGSPIMQQAQQAFGQVVGGQPAQAAQNQFGQGVSADRNPYMGANNPYLSDQINAAQGDLVRSWNTVAAPQFDTMMARSGSVGNEGVREATALGMDSLQRNLGRVSSDMRMQDYGMQSQLGENYANRQTQAQQFNASLGEQMAGRQDAMSSNNRSAVLQALGLSPALAGADYQDIDRLVAAGGAYQAQDQRGLDAAYQQFAESRQYPREQLGIMGDALGRSYGQTTSQEVADPNRAAQAIGGALTFAQLMKLLGG